MYYQMTRSSGGKTSLAAGTEHPGKCNQSANYDIEAHGRAAAGMPDRPSRYQAINIKNTKTGGKVMTYSDIGIRATRRALWRLLPFLVLMLVLNWLDRVNVGFAALQMNQDLNFSATVYGFGAGIFFVAYALCEVPSNMIMHRVGARVWIARIMITWGITASAMVFIQGPTSFYSLRFLLGIAEAGFYPGVVVYLTYWFPAREKARALAFLFTGQTISVIVGGPLSTALLALNGWAGLRGWQWMFILEGIPSIMVGIFALYYLTDHPKDATWLSREERDWLTQQLAREQEAKTKEGEISELGALLDRRILVYAAAFFCLVIGILGMTLWLPQLIKGMGNLTNFQVGLLSAVPFLCGAVALNLNGIHSDKTGERKLHIGLSGLVGAVGFVMCAYFTGPVWQFAGICVAAMGVLSAAPLFWTMPTALLVGGSAASGVAFINSVGNLGGFFGPYMIGWVKDTTQSYSGALYVLAAFLVIFAAIILTRRHNPKMEMLGLEQTSQRVVADPGVAHLEGGHP
jgi:ACS family tartrate transporter-like MFS transporter